MSTDNTRKVVKASRSPMNHKRWLLRLECGHDVWVTSASRPTRKSVQCALCARENSP